MQTETERDRWRQRETDTKGDSKKTERKAIAASERGLEGMSRETARETQEQEETGRQPKTYIYIIYKLRRQRERDRLQNSAMQETERQREKMRETAPLVSPFVPLWCLL